MSDGIDPSSQIRRSRPSDGNSSNSTLAIVLAVVAVVAGFLILRSLNNSGTDASVGAGAGGGGGATTASSTVATADTTPIVTSTTLPAIDFSGASIIVANANGVSGSAGKMSDAIKAAGGTMVAPVDATTPLDVSQILYDPSQPEAQKVATSLSLILSPSPAPAPLSGEPPISGDRGGAGVIFLLGKDLAEAKVNLPSQPATTLTIAPSTNSATASATASG